jgi:hypothetical protein
MVAKSSASTQETQDAVRQDICPGRVALPPGRPPRNGLLRDLSLRELSRSSRCRPVAFEMRYDMLRVDPRARLRDLREKEERP